MNLKKYDQREEDLIQAKEFCNQLHKMIIKNILDGSTYQVEHTRIDKGPFQSLDHVITVTIKGTHYHKADVRYSQ